MSIDLLPIETLLHIFSYITDNSSYDYNVRQLCALNIISKTFHDAILMHPLMNSLRAYKGSNNDQNSTKILRRYLRGE